MRGGTWFLRNSNTTGVADITFNYGNAGDLPVAGDWDSTGSSTPGVVRNGTWFLRNSNSTGIADATFGYGNPSDIPLAGDWDGNGSTTPGVIRGGTWFLRNSNTSGNGRRHLRLWRRRRCATAVAQCMRFFRSSSASRR